MFRLVDFDTSDIILNMIRVSAKCQPRIDFSLRHIFCPSDSNGIATTLKHRQYLQKQKVINSTSEASLDPKLYFPTIVIICNNTNASCKDDNATDSKRARTTSFGRLKVIHTCM